MANRIWQMLIMGASLLLPGIPSAQIITSTLVNTPTSAASPSTTTTFSGRVISRSGAPVPEARVSLLPLGFSCTQVNHSAPQMRTQHPVTNTDREGTFSFNIERNRSGTLCIQAEGYADTTENLQDHTGSFPIRNSPANPATTRTITLEKATQVTGIAADENGNPLPGVEIIANPATIIGYPDYNNQLDKTETDGDGRFTLPKVPDVPLALRFRAPGYATAFVTTQPGEPVAVNLTLGTTVSGTAVDLEGQPVAGVRLSLSAQNAAYSSENRDKPKPFPRQWGGTAISGESGAFSFRHVPTGQYVLGVARESNEGPAYAVWTPGTNFYSLSVSEDAPPAPITLLLFNGYTIKGRVVEADTTSTVANARVWLTSYQHPHIWTTTDAAGQFSFDNLVNLTSAQLAADAEGFQTLASDNSSSNNTTVTITAQMPTSSPLIDVTIYMKRKQVMAGVVLDAATSQPVSGATVQAVENRFPSNNSQKQDATVVTGPDGRFSLSAYPGEALRLRAQAPGYAPAISDPVAKNLDGDIVLALTLGRKISGLVVDPDNKPIAGARISGSLRLGTAQSASGARSLYHEPLPGNIRSADDGTFEFQLVPPGAQASLTASLDGFAPSESATYFVPKADDITSVILKLRIAKALSGRVLSPDGQPLKDANVSVTSNDTNGSGYARSQPDGTYSFKNLPDSPVQVNIFHQNHGMEYFYDVAVGRDNVDFQFGKGDKDGRKRMEEARRNQVRKTGATLYGRVVDYKTNLPVKDFKVIASYGSKAALNPDVEGGFTIEGLLVGSPYQTIRITAAGYAPFDSDSIYVMAGQTKIEKTFKLGPGGSVTGRAVDQSTKKPVPGVIISLGSDLYSAVQSPQDQKLQPVVTAGDGTFNLPGVGQGRKVLTFEPPPDVGYVKMSKDVEVTYNESTDMGDVEFGSGGTIRGKLVRMPGSIPIPDARIEARDQKAVTTDAEGAFEFTNLLNGLYFIEAPTFGANSWVGIDNLETRELTLEVGSGTLVGTVSRAGEPVSCEVKLQKVGPGQSVARVIKSDQAGLFLIQGLAPGRWSVQFTGTGRQAFTASDVVIMPPSGEDVEKTFTLPSGTLRVTVMDAAGQPVKNAQVTVRQLTSADAALQADSNTGLTSADGTESFAGLDGGTYAVTAMTEDGQRGTNDQVVIENGQSASATVTLEPASGGTLVSTTLNITNGKPLSAAWCYLFNKDGQMFEHNSQRDETGVMTINNIPPGQYRVQISAFSYSATEHNIEIKGGETENLQDVLYPAGGLRWVLRDATGVAVVGATCTVTPADASSPEQPRTGTTNAEGLYIARGLMPGNYTATAKTRNGQSATAQIIIGAASNSDIITMVK